MCVILQRGREDKWGVEDRGEKEKTLYFLFEEWRQYASSCSVALLSSENTQRHHTFQKPPWLPRKRELMNRDRRYQQKKKCFIYYSLISRSLCYSELTSSLESWRNTSWFDIAVLTQACAVSFRGPGGSCVMEPPTLPACGGHRVPPPDPSVGMNSQHPWQTLPCPTCF